MKYGIYFAYWTKEWFADYKKYMDKVSALGFDVLEISCAALRDVYTTKEQLIDFLSYYEPGEDVELTLEVPDGKGYKEETVTVTLGENTNTQSTDSKDNGDGQGSSQDDNLLEDWENNEGGSGLQYGEGWN